MVGLCILCPRLILMNSWPVVISGSAYFSCLPLPASPFFPLTGSIVFRVRPPIQYSAEPSFRIFGRVVGVRERDAKKVIFVVEWRNMGCMFYVAVPSCFVKLPLFYRLKHRQVALASPSTRPLPGTFKLICLELFSLYGGFQMVFFIPTRSSYS